MKYLSVLILFPLLLWNCKTSNKFVHNKSLFNGEDLKGWRVFGTEEWYVNDGGELIGKSGPDHDYGYLATRKFYKNFILELEFLQEANTSSGVFFRSTLKGNDIHGWEAEVAPPGKHTGGIYESHEYGWMVKPTMGGTNTLKMGEWNTMKIYVNGDMVKTWLNGRQLLELQDEKIGAAKGRIALQLHAGDDNMVRWRNIVIHTEMADEL